MDNMELITKTEGRELILTRPLAFFDLETTGINTAKDKIVSVSIIKLYPDGKRNSFYSLINPAMPIPIESSKIHGIYDEHVQDKPFFKDMAPTIELMFKDSDIAGYNCNHFDIPLLSNEFSPLGITFPSPGTMFIDVCTIYKTMNPRNLSAAYERYTGKKLEDAHNSENDNEATIDIFLAQIKEHPELPLTIQGIDEMYGGASRVDISGKFIKNPTNGAYYFNFGKYKNEPIQKGNLHYLAWMYSEKSDFSEEVKGWAKKIYKEIAP